MSQIYKRVFTLELTTATFMHGADPRRDPKLRPPAIKGVMRYWFRALAGAYCSKDLIEEKEAALFGSTSTGAKLMVRLVGTPAPSLQPARLLPHKPGSPVPALAAANQFEISLQPYPALTSDIQIELLAVASWVLWVAVNLGGFGQRARRGAGSLRLLKIEPALTGLPLTFPIYRSTQELAQRLEQGLQETKAAIATYLETSQTLPPSRALPDFPVLSPAYAQVQVRNLLATDEEAARQEIMLELRDFKNPCFGLPYMLTAPGDRPIEKERHASPLHLHLVKLDSSFALVQTVLRSRFNNLVQLDWQKMDDYLASKPAHKVEIK